MPIYALCIRKYTPNVIKCVKLLLKNGLNVNQTDRGHRGTTALDEALHHIRMYEQDRIEGSEYEQLCYTLIDMFMAYGGKYRHWYSYKKHKTDLTPVEWHVASFKWSEKLHKYYPKQFKINIICYLMLYKQIPCKF